MNILLLTLAFIAQPDEDMYKLIAGERMATLSTNYKTFPFGSLTPFLIDKKGNPVLFLSDLAQHTKNIKKDAKCSFMVHKIDKNDIFNSPRITFAGKLVKMTDDERETISKDYLKRHPEAASFIDFGDFNFYRLIPEHIQYIGGFGDINWIEVKEYRKGLK